MSSYTRVAWITDALRAEAARINLIPFAERTAREQQVVETVWAVPTAREFAAIAATPEISFGRSR